MKPPSKVLFKWYGWGLPQKYAIPCMTLYPKLTQERMDGGHLILEFQARIKRHYGYLLVRLFQWLRHFCNIRKPFHYIQQEFD